MPIDFKELARKAAERREQKAGGVMAWEDRELAGVIFKNRQKRTEKHPDWRGTLLVNGEPCEIALWEKSGQKGPYYSFKIGPAREQPAHAAGDDRGSGGARANAEDDDRW